MYDKRAMQDASRLGILDKLQALEDDLMKKEDIEHVEYDIRDFGTSHTKQLILIPKYTIDVHRDDYYMACLAKLNSILKVCEKHGLMNSGDLVEDMGEHWYIVRDCDGSWQ